MIIIMYNVHTHSVLGTILAPLKERPHCNVHTYIACGVYIHTLIKLTLTLESEPLTFHVAVLLGLRKRNMNTYIAYCN